MDAIKHLRTRLAARRDEAIKKARADFKHGCRLLDQLDQSLGQETPARQPRKGHQSNVALIAEVMPKDRTFTIQDILGLLERSCPGRKFPAPTIRAEFRNLIDRGIIRRIRKTSGGIVHWAASECEVIDEPIAAMTMADAAEVVLSEMGPLTSAEIIVNLKERGYRPDDDPRVLLTSLREAIKRNAKRFSRDEDGKWGCNS
jgi:hypothetical protein